MTKTDFIELLDKLIPNDNQLLGFYIENGDGTADPIEMLSIETRVDTYDLTTINFQKIETYV